MGKIRGYRSECQRLILSVKYELGLDESGKRIVDRSSHTTIIRRIGARKKGEETSAKK